MTIAGATCTQLEHIEAIERRLWSAADTLRANSNYASNEYCPAGHGARLPASRIQPLPCGQARDRGFPPHARRQGASPGHGGLLPEERHLPAARGPVRPPGGTPRRRGPGERDHRRDGVRECAAKADSVYKLAVRLVATCEQECDAKSAEEWNARDVNRARKAVDLARERAVARLRRVRHHWRQADWLTSRFPDSRLRDVPGLVKVVDLAEIAANDWSLAPGRYVGVAPEEEDEDFDFGEALREIHRAGGAGSGGGGAGGADSTGSSTISAHELADGGPCGSCGLPLTPRAENGIHLFRPARQTRLPIRAVSFHSSTIPLTTTVLTS